MKWSVVDFCGMLAWTLTVHCIWLSIFLPLREHRSTEICYLTMSEIGELRCPVEADDGFVYDAVNLQHWLKTCRENDREISVIPRKPITRVRPIRVWRLIPRLDYCGIAKRICKQSARLMKRLRTRRCKTEASTQTGESGPNPPGRVSPPSHCTWTGIGVPPSTQLTPVSATNFEWLPRKVRLQIRPYS